MLSTRFVYPGASPTDFRASCRAESANASRYARALVATPDLLICDEITSSLDVSVQGAVLGLLGDLRTTLGLAMLFITHDLGVVASVADRVLVLNRGEICEEGPVRAVLDHPTDSYTRALIAAAPRLELISSPT